MKVIVALSGGKASAYCADWALKNYPKQDVILYFNDTKWEHPDLYRFLIDLEKHFAHSITYDSDGRSPEILMWEHHALANNRMPFCSRILKAERLQKFYSDGDFLVFGIGLNELHRAKRIKEVYSLQNKENTVLFPLLLDKITPDIIDTWLSNTGIIQPELYRKGFTHNNCSGGCVRQGARQWIQLLQTYPEIYKKREDFEEKFRNRFNKDVHFLKEVTLKKLRLKYQAKDHFDFSDDAIVSECIGICSTLN